MRGGEYGKIIKALSKMAETAEKKDRDILTEAADIIFDYSETARMLARRTAGEKAIERRNGSFFFWQCPQCQKLVASGSNYCSECGQRLKWEFARKNGDSKDAGDALAHGRRQKRKKGGGGQGRRKGRVQENAR